MVWVVRTVGIVLAVIAFMGWWRTPYTGPFPFYGIMVLQAVSVFLSTYRIKHINNIVLVGLCIAVVPFLAAKLRGISW